MQSHFLPTLGQRMSSGLRNAECENGYASHVREHGKNRGQRMRETTDVGRTEFYRWFLGLRQDLVAHVETNWQRGGCALRGKLGIVTFANHTFDPEKLFDAILSHRARERAVGENLVYRENQRRVLLGDFLLHVLSYCAMARSGVLSDASMLGTSFSRS